MRTERVEKRSQRLVRLGRQRFRQPGLDDRVELQPLRIVCTGAELVQLRVNPAVAAHGQDVIDDLQRLGASVSTSFK